jgi:hypothetical protein
MAAKTNTTKPISLKNGSMGPNGSGLTTPRPGSVLGGGTLQTTKSNDTVAKIGKGKSASGLGGKTPKTGKY